MIEHVNLDDYIINETGTMIEHKFNEKVDTKNN